MPKNSAKQSLDDFRLACRSYSDASIMMHEAIARQAGLSGTDHKYLGFLIEKGELTAGELSQLIGLTTGAVTGVIDRLEKKKLVNRKFDPNDRRKVFIVPHLDNTQKLLAPLFATLQKRTSELMASFSEKEIETVQRYFLGARTIMREITNTMNE